MIVSKIKNVSFNNKRSGSALAFIVIALLVVAILTSSILYIFNSNLKQAKYQEYAMEAYYLAYSGVEMGLSAITANSNALLEEVKNGSKTSLIENDIEFGRGFIDIIVIKSSDVNFEDWIKITSTGRLRVNNQSFTRSLYLNPSNINDFVWVNN